MYKKYTDSGHPESGTSPLILSRVWAIFKNPSLESAYRAESRSESRVRVSITISLFVIITAVLALLGVLTSGDGEFDATLLPRVLIALIAITYLFVDRTVTTIPLSDFLTATIFTGLGVLHLWITSLRGPSYLGNVGLDVLFIISMYLLVSIPLYYQLMVASIFTVGAYLVLRVLRTELDPLSIDVVTTGLLLANIVGFLFSNRMGKVNRAYYFSYRQECDIRMSLENALAEVKTLSELLPICCVCKKVRDDKGYWSNVEKYLHSHLNQKLTHGYCPDCFADQMRELDESRTSSSKNL